MTDEAPPLIRLEGVTLAYGPKKRETVVFQGLDLTVAAGESLALIGPSGCGKTSVLYALCGLLPPRAGRITLAGEPVRGPRREVALILQDAGLLPWKTVWQNAALGLKLAGERTDRLAALLEELDIAPLAHRYPAELSGGQRQRVGIARALAVNPCLLLMDEPLANLDAFTKERIQNLILALWRRRGHTQILVTHDLEEAVFLGRRILALAGPPGRILAEIDNPQVGSPGWRASDGFFAQVRKLREVLG